MSYTLEDSPHQKIKLILLQKIYKLNKTFRSLFLPPLSQVVLGLYFLIWKSTWITKCVGIALFVLVTIRKTFIEDNILSYHFKNFATNLWIIYIQLYNTIANNIFPIHSGMDHPFFCQKDWVPFFMWEWYQVFVKKSSKGKEIGLGVLMPTPGK